MDNKQLLDIYKFVENEDSRLMDLVDDAYDEGDTFKILVSEYEWRKNAVRHTKLLKALTWRELMEPRQDANIEQMYQGMVEEYEEKYYDLAEAIKEHPVDFKFDKKMLKLTQRLYKKAYELFEAYKEEDYDTILDRNIEIAELEYVIAKSKLDFWKENYDEGDDE